MLDYVESIVANPGRPLPLLALASQRLAAWDAVRARAVIRAAMSAASDPLARRALAMASLNAGEPRRMVKKWLAGTTRIGSLWRCWRRVTSGRVTS